MFFRDGIQGSLRRAEYGGVIMTKRYQHRQGRDGQGSDYRIPTPVPSHPDTGGDREQGEPKKDHHG